MSRPTIRNIALISLGCAKNMVDAECMSQQLSDAGHQIISDPAEAEVVIVNTCGFIESAKQEAIGTILDMAAFKAPQGRADYLIVTGCLAQRYRAEIKAQMPEVDAVLGVSEYKDIAATVERLYGEADAKAIQNTTSDPASQPDAAASQPGAAESQPDAAAHHAAAVDARLQHLSTRRKPSTVGHAYIKIAEGCSNCCTYCAIPGIRGPFISRPLEDLVEEARALSGQGYRELILIAQDTTRYGIDLYGRRDLPRLLRAIAALPEVRTIRVLYVYADGITDELVECLAGEPKILHYLDLPIQHASDMILRRMNRRDTQASLRQTIARLRAAMPDLVLRTTVMVGFPGETAHAFGELLAFVRDMRFERLGCFIFSPEEGTPAEQMHPRVRSDVAVRREARIMTLQQEITRTVNEARIGTIVPVLLEQVDEDGIFYRGRSYAEAPEVDPVILVAATDASVRTGEIYPVRILAANEYELTGETVL